MATFFFKQTQNVELVVEGGNPIGGAVVATHVWMQALYEIGHRVVLSMDENDTRSKLPGYEWIETYPLFDSNKGFPIIRYIYYRYPKIFKALKKIQPDVVIESIPSWSTPINSLFCRLSKAKHLIRLANDNMVDERIKLSHSWFEQQMIYLGFRWCDFILVQNSYQFEKLKNRYPNKKIVKISNPIVLDQTYLVRKTKPEGYIAWVANFRYQKNLKLLFKIASSLPKENFLIAGQPTSHIDSESTIFLTKLKNLQNVKFLGSVPRNAILDFFKGAKFLLNTSRHEGFSNTFLEAMCTGTPILSTEMVNPDQIITMHKLGYIYKDIIDLKTFLENLEDSNYANLSFRCLEFVQSQHDHLILGKRLLEFLEISSEN